MTDQSTYAIVLDETASGPLALGAGEFYLAPAAQAWEYLQDMHRIAVGLAPDETLARYEVSAGEALQHHSNGVACVMGDLLALGPESTTPMFDSLLDFVRGSESLDGLEGVFLSAGLTALRAGGGSELLERAEQVWDAVGGLPDVLAGGGSIVPLLDGAAGVFGFPSVESLTAVFDDPLGAAANIAGAPAHGLFDRVQGLLGTIDTDAGTAFADFRESPAGQVVESVVGIGIGILTLVEGPAVKLGVHAIQGVLNIATGVVGAIVDGIDFLGGLITSIFGSSDNEDDGGGSSNRIADGTHVPVGCRVQTRPGDQASDLASNDGEGGLCPPDFGVPPGIPPLDDSTPWPTRPVPVFSGPGLDQLINFDGQTVSVPFVDVDGGALYEVLSDLDTAALTELAGKLNAETVYTLDLRGAGRLDITTTGSDLVVAYRRDDAYRTVLTATPRAGAGERLVWTRTDPAALRPRIDLGTARSADTLAGLIRAMRADLVALA
jgi:hypothetical protein